MSRPTPSEAKRFTPTYGPQPKPQAAGTTQIRRRTRDRRPPPVRSAPRRSLQGPFPHPRPNRGPPNNPHLPRPRRPLEKRRQHPPRHQRTNRLSLRHPHPPRLTNRRPHRNLLRLFQGGPDTRSRSSTDSELASVTWEALGTSVVLRVTDPAALAHARAQVERELDGIDRACSRFRADSELSRVNTSDGRPVQIGELLMEALELAVRAAELTGGDVDPTVGRALELAGYDRDWRLLTPCEERAGYGPPRRGETIDKTRRGDKITGRARAGG